MIASFLTSVLCCSMVAAQISPLDALGVISARTLAHKPPRRAQSEYNRGWKAVRSGREASVHFAEAVRIDPEFLEAHVMLGTVRHRAGRFIEALESYLRVIELEPRDAGYRASVALILLELRRPAEAEGYARGALRLAPGYMPAHLALGVALIEQDHFTPEAVASLRAAADQHPTARALLTMVEARASPK